jgi:hypothetical protein
VLVVVDAFGEAEVPPEKEADRSRSPTVSAT